MKTTKSINTRLKYRILKQTILSVFFFSVFSCNSQNAEKSSKSQYSKLIYKECPNADILEIEEREDFTEIEYLCNEQIFEVGINDGKIIFSETKADRATIPYDKIEQKLEKSYPGWILDEVSLVTIADTSFLKAEIVKKGYEQNVYFTTTGKWYKAKPITFSEKWNVENLSENPVFQQAEYNYLKPDNVYEMPELLNEISGIAIKDTNTIMCIQDEVGAVFEYSLSGETIKNIYRFTDLGDFEDVAVNGNTIYVLRSDGSVFDFDCSNLKKPVGQNLVPTSALNIEGLFYDAPTNYFYLACKEKTVNTDDSKRTIFRYTKKTIHTPEKYLDIDLNNVNEVFSKNFPAVAATSVSFNPSAIAVNPITKDVYVLSSVNRLLLIYKNKKLKNIYPLPTEIYLKPEGISFFKNGDLLISSEGDKRGLIKGSINLLKRK